MVDELEYKSEIRRLFGWLLPYFRRDPPSEMAADIVRHSWRSLTSSFWEVICQYCIRTDAETFGDLPVLCMHGHEDDSAPLDAAMALADGRQSWQD